MTALMLSMAMFWSGTVVSSQVSGSLPRLIVQSSPVGDFQMQIQPSQSLMRNGTIVTPSLVFTPQNGFYGNVTVTMAVSPGGTYSPKAIFPYSYVTLNAASPGSPAFGFNVTTTNMTPSGVYTITATGTSGSISHTATTTIGVTSVFVPAYGAEVLYNIGFYTPAYVGSSTGVNVTFTDLGYVPVMITKIVVNLDFGTYESMPNQVVNPYKVGAADVAGIIILPSFPLGPHPYTVTVSWLVDPLTIYQTQGSDIVTHGTLNVYANNPLPGVSPVLGLVLIPVIMADIAAGGLSIFIVNRHEKRKQAAMSPTRPGMLQPTVAKNDP
jgi:hypothetical protein